MKLAAVKTPPPKVVHNEDEIKPDGLLLTEKGLHTSEGLKPVPVIDTTVPVGPEVGVRAIFGETSVKDALP